MKKISVVLIYVLLFACQTKTPHVTNSPPKNSINSSMQSLKLQIESIFPEAFNQKSFHAPVNEPRLMDQFKQLSATAKQVSHDKAMKVEDPILSQLAIGFRDELDRANTAFASGQKEYARNSLIHAVSYCVECHTRTTSGPQFVSQSDAFGLKDAKLVERGQYRLAMREFQLALSDFFSVIDSRGVKHSFFDFEKAVRFALVIGVRYQNDPEIVEKVSKSLLNPESQAPYFLRNSALAWQQAIVSWKQDLNKSSTRANRLVKARSLIESAKRRQSLGDERSGDVEMLRAQRELHLLLEPIGPDANISISVKDKAEAMYWLGIAYSSFRDHALWNLQEAYFETCIRMVPRSVTAKRCYSALEENYHSDYSGTGGFDLPEEIKVKLLDLRKLAVEKDENRP